MTSVLSPGLGCVPNDLYVKFLGYGVFLTADSILLLLVLGPTASRTFINALYFFMRQFIHNASFLKVKISTSLQSGQHRGR
jgi:hypothetical protein